MRSKRKTFFSILVLIILVIAAHFFGLLNPLENILRGLVSPGSNLMYGLSVNISGQEDKCADELLKNKTAETALQLAEEENNELRAQSQFLQKQKWQTVGADVTGKNIDTLGNTLIINRGARDGVKENNPVIINDGILIGKIARVEEKISIIRLINDNQSKFAATIMNTDRSLGLIEGGYGISVQMNYIPQNEAINIGETIITSGLEENVPRGLLIGTIETVEKEAYQPFQKAIVKPLANLNKINLVSVIIGH
ncbi:MAG: rod shape-determining protein MreC [Patescibacteria group bacterium]